MSGGELAGGVFAVCILAVVAACTAVGVVSLLKLAIDIIRGKA